MMRLLCALSLALVSVAYGQQVEVIGTLEPSFEVGYTQVLFVGDTMLVRLVSDHQKSSDQVSVAAWYNASGKIADVDLNAFSGSEIMGIAKSRDTLYYYAYKEGDDLAVFNSVGLNSIKALTQIKLVGTPVRGIARDTGLLLITWEVKSQTVRFYDIRNDRSASERQLHLELPKEIRFVKAHEIAFPMAGEAERIGVMNTTLRFFLNGDTFAAVYDMPGSLYPQDVAKYKTGIVRFNLSTGEQHDQSIFSNRTFSFKSFLVGSNHLYRLVISKDSVRIKLYDLDDSHKAPATHPIIVPAKQEVATTRHGSEHTIRRSKDMKPMAGTRSKPGFDLGITVDEYNNEQVISVGYIVDVKGNIVPIGGPLPVGMVVSMVFTAVLQKQDLHNLTYVYLHGTPEAGYKLTKPDEIADFLKVQIDRFEFDTQAQGDVDYMMHFTNRNYCISIYSHKKSPIYKIVTFPVKP